MAQAIMTTITHAHSHMHIKNTHTLGKGMNTPAPL